MVCRDRLIGLFETWQAELESQHCIGPRRFARDRQILRMRKRAQLGDTSLSAKAVTDFIRTNDEVGAVALRLTPNEIHRASLFVRNALERAHRLVDEADVQGVLDIDHVLSHWRFGPGSSHGTRGSHAVEKLRGEMACTARCLPLVVKLRGTNRYINLYDQANKRPVPLVSGSKLAVVPKNEVTDRTISIEPSGNMCLQLAAGTVLESALRTIGVDIRTQQPKNKALASKAHRDGLATIDMKSASDMISPHLVRALMPKEWYHLLDAIRSPTTILPDGTQLKLNMFSTMGNGFTFPLMTLIFCALLSTASEGCNWNHIDWRRHAVFGDDVICPQSSFDAVVDVFQRAGLVINTDKSFSAGFFFESCGGDYYDGQDVTPVYPRTLDSPARVYTVINQILRWSALHEFSCIHTIRYLIGLLPGKKPYLVPQWHNPDSGLLCCCGPRRYKYLQPLQRQTEYVQDIFAMMLAVGGYVESSGARMFYIPRKEQVRYVTRNGRYPSGYLEGWDPSWGSSRMADWVSLMVTLV